MLSGTPALVVAAALLLLVLGAAVGRPWGRSEALFAVPAAVAVVGLGAISPRHALAEVERLAPVVAFLAAVLVLARMCDEEGLFRAGGAVLARAAARATRPGGRLLLVTFAAASATTVVLSLDATVVLLTPVVLATAHRLRVRPRPHALACAHLSNSASLLLPVSNLTNLLAFEASGLTFGRFAALMALPWLVVVAVEYLVFRWVFAPELADGRTAAETVPATRSSEPEGSPRFAVVVVAATLAGFAVGSAFGIDLAPVAAAGAIALAVHALLRRRTRPATVLRATAPGFLVFVLALGVLVRAVVDNGLGAGLAHLLPGGAGLPALLATVALAAVAANLINNLPAVLALLPLAEPLGTGAVLAVLLGVNIGPNLTYVGSLATLLWRRVLRGHGTEIGLSVFTRLGLLTVPACLAASGVALWLSLRAVGG